MRTPLYLRFFTDVAFMTPSAAAAILKAAEIKNAEHPFFAKVKGQMKPQTKMTEDGIAIIPVEGVLARKPSVFEMFDGVEDTSVLQELFDAAASDPQVKGIMLTIDSPGGFMTGGPELADSIRRTDERVKPVHAWTGGAMASLAYWIGSQAGMITATRSAQVGSIGAYTAIPDYSKLFEAHGVKMEVFKNKEAKYKAAGVAGTSLTEDHRQNIQERIQSSFNEFRRAVSNKRPNAPAEAFQGQSMSGKEAQKTGLVDAVGDFAGAMKMLRRTINKSFPD
jgi:signal peptide peptidase SppA